MAIDKALAPYQLGQDDIDLVTLNELEAGVEDFGTTENPAVEETEDGGAIVRFGPEEQEPVEQAFGSNIAETMTDQELTEISLDLLDKYDADKASRKDWENTYKQGLNLLGLTFEDRTEPFEGACGTFHPVMAEAVVRFQAQAIRAIFPPEGPVRGRVLGKQTVEKDKQARRVSDYMNYKITEELPEYRAETERLLFALPTAGSAFRKMYPDPTTMQPVARYVPAEDLIVSYACPDLDTAERVTHRMRVAYNTIRKRQVSGFYRDVELQEAVDLELDDVDEKKDSMIGVRVSGPDKDTRHVLLEVHTDLDLGEDPDGIMLPYVVTIDKSSSEILSIYRNWREDDAERKRRSHFVHYQYIPGVGFYAFGLAHLIGGLTKSATSLLRQLVDAGTLANLPGGLKTRGLRAKLDETPIAPGEWRDVDVPGGTIKDNIYPLPYKEPSATLYQLLTNLVEDARRFASTADMKVSDMTNEAPVGTTLAIIERAMLIQTSVQARLHDSLKKEFRILASLINDYTQPAYPYEVDPSQEIKQADFDGRVDVVPVSDPNASTMAQRIMQYQATLQLASQAPQLYDLRALHRQVVEALGVPQAEKIVPYMEEIPPADPVTENMNILNLKPVQAHEHQDHEAHIKTHVAMAGDPQIAQHLQNSQSGPQVQAAMDAHIREHFALLYRYQVEEELGTPLPPLGAQLPEDVEKRISTLAADAADALTGKKRALARAEEVAEQLEDPVVQQKIREMDIREMDVKRKAKADEEKAKLEREKIAQQREEAYLEAQERHHEHSVDSQIEAVRLGADIARDANQPKNDGRKENE